MLRVKITIQCILLLSFLFLGAYAAYQLFSVQDPIEENPYELLEPYPSESPDTGLVAQALSYNYEALLAQNEDFIAWLTIPDTVISFPVVQGDDNQYYLDHAFSGDYSVFGCPFLDTRTPLDGENLVIHGHNMGNNRTEMFSTLLYYQDPDYAKEHSTIQLSTLDGGGGTYTLFAVANVSVKNPSISYIRSSFSSNSERQDFLASLQSCSLYAAEEIPDGQILILSTCNRTYGTDNRLVLVAIRNE